MSPGAVGPSVAREKRPARDRVGTASINVRVAARRRPDQPDAQVPYNPAVSLMPWLRALLIAGLLAPPIAEPGARYTVVTWTTEQGLPTNAISDVEQTADGYVWFASFEGITRFDGVNFRTFGRADLPGVDRAEFTALAAGPDGSLWAFGSPAGVLRHHQGRWSSLTARDGLMTDQVTALLMGRGGDLWIGTTKGVNRYARNGRIDSIAPPPEAREFQVNALAEDGAGTLWIGTANGLLRARDGVASRVPGMASGNITVLLAARDASVLALQGADLKRIQNGMVSSVAFGGRPWPERITSMLEDRNGTLWVGAANGLFRLDGDTVAPARLAEGMTNTFVNTLLEDAEGNLWITSPQAGLVRLQRQSFTTIGVADGLPHDLVYNVAGDAAGGEWVATVGGVAHRTADGTTLYTRENGGLPNNTARDLIQSRTGAVWVATMAGLTRLEAGHVTTYTVRDGLPPDPRQRVLLEDRGGSLWIGGYAGLTELRDGRFHAHGADQGLPDGYILSLFEDRQGTLWVGTQSAGLFRRVDGRFVAAGGAFEHQPIFHLTEDADSTLWIGTSRGLARLRNGVVRHFTVADGLHSNTIFHALDDGAGHLWLSSPAGVARVSRDSLEAVAAGRQRLLTARQFGRADGMVSRESTQIARGWRSPDGRLWFPTPAGLAWVDPARVPHNAVAPVVHVESILADDRAFTPAGAVELPAGTRKVEFRYTSPSFVSPAQLRFRYRLDGFDQDWVDGGGSRVTAYTNLAPGQYTFRAQARNEDGVWSERPAAIAVSLAPHFWQTRSFLFGLGLAAAGLVLALHRLRVGAVERGMREEMLRAMSLHDDLTGLYNRRGLLALAEQHVRSMMRTGRGFSIVFIDMDGMKRINDTQGHAEGDRALVDVATLLRTTFRESDISARIGGDEFAILALDEAEGTGENAAEAACARLVAAVDRHNRTAGRPYQLSLSIGVSRCDPLSPEPLETVIEEADRRMFAQKRQKGAGRDLQ